MRLGMWITGDIRKLTPAGQHLYFVLLTHPDLSYCGVADWRPGRLAPMADGWTPEQVISAGEELVRKLFIVIDEDTEEALIRSFIRNDGLMKESRVAVSMVKAFGGVASSKLRGVIVHELRRLHAEDPTLHGWSTTRGEPGQALDLLILDPINPADLVNGLGVGLGTDLGEGLGTDLGVGLGQTLPKVWGSVSVPTSPAPSPSPSPPSNEGVRGSRVPDDFTPTPASHKWGKARGFSEAAIKDLTEEFITYWQAKPGKDAIKLDWQGTWKNWLRREDPEKRNRRLRSISDNDGPARHEWDM